MIEKKDLGNIFIQNKKPTVNQRLKNEKNEKYLQSQQKNNFDSESLQSSSDFYAIPKQKINGIPVEMKFEISLDKSLDIFKKRFNEEFRKTFQDVKSRQNAIEINDFVDSFKGEIESIITTPITPVDLKLDEIQHKVGGIIDAQTRSLHSLLLEANHQIKQATDCHINELKKLNEEFNDLNDIFGTSTKKILDELDKEIRSASAINKSEQERNNELKEKEHSLKFKKAELMTKENHQQTDLKNLESMIKEFEDKRLKWENEELPFFYDEESCIRSKILSELNEIKDIVEQQSFNEVNQNIDEGIKALREDGESLKTELMSLEISNKWAASQTYDLSLFQFQEKPYNFNDMQDQIEELRKKRNNIIQEIAITEEIY